MTKEPIIVAAESKINAIYINWWGDDSLLETHLPLT